MGSSPSKHVEVKTDLTSALVDGDASSTSPNQSNFDSSATSESDDAGWIGCPCCLQLLDDPRLWPGCGHPVCRGCYLPDAACRLCGQVGRQPNAEELARDLGAVRRLARWCEPPKQLANNATSTAAKSKAQQSTKSAKSTKSNSDSDSTTSGDNEQGDADEVAVEVDGESATPLPPLPSKAAVTEAERILMNNCDLLRRQLRRWADEAERLDQFVADCHRAIDEEADNLRRVQRDRQLRAQQQSAEQADALHKLRLGAARLRAAASADQKSSACRAASPSLASTAGALQRRIETARQGALAWHDAGGDGGFGERDGGDAANGDPDADDRLARLREFASAAAAELLHTGRPAEPSTATRLRPAPAAAAAAAARRRSFASLVTKRRRQPTGMTPTRELPGVHVWDIAIVRHTGSLCYRADAFADGDNGSSGGGASSGDIRYGPAGGKWRPLPNPCLCCLLPASSRLLAVSPDGTQLAELKLSPRRPRGNLERLRCLEDRLYLSEPEFVYITDLSGLCLHVLAGFSWAMGLWPDPVRRRLLVVNGDRQCVEIFGLDTFSHEGSLCDDEFTDDLTGVCVVNNRILVADHTAYRMHVYRSDNLQLIGRLQVSAPRFLDVDSTGVVYITGDQAEYHQVTVLDPENGRQFSCGFEGTRFGEFRSPSGLAVDEVAGEVYVCDFDNERVQVFALS